MTYISYYVRLKDDLYTEW